MIVRVDKETLITARWALFYAFIFLMCLCMGGVGVVYLITGKMISGWTIGIFVLLAAVWISLYIKFRRLRADSQETLAKLKELESSKG